MRAGLLCAITVTLAVLSGCTSHVQRLGDIRLDYYTGDLATARASIDEQLEKRGSRKEVDVLMLDRAIIDLVSGRPEQAELTLRRVRDNFEHLEQKSSAEYGLSMFNDDTSLAYAGEDYEKLLVRAFLSLSNLMYDGRDARAYGYQVATKQDEIIRSAGQPESNPKLGYKQVALGAYLCGIMDEQSPTSLDAARRSYQRVVNWEPFFETGKTSLERATHSVHSSPGNGVLYVFTLVGPGPYKIEVNEEPTQAALLVADQIISAMGKYELPPTIAPVKVPQVVAEQSSVCTIGVSVDDQPYGVTETVTDIGSLAVQQHRAIYQRVVGRAVVRRIVKKGSIYAVKDHLDVNPYVGLAMTLGGVAWEATENADTRCWGLLPDRIQVLRIELPVGRHRIGLSAVNHQGMNGQTFYQDVQIDAGRNSYAMGCFPSAKLVGQIVTNCP